MRVSICALILQVLLHAHGQLIRDRSVQCNSSEMRVSFEFVQPFTGVVYSNRLYQTKECRWEGNGSRNLLTAIPLNSNPNAQPFCGVQVKEDTGEFTVTLIISPMRGLLVDGMEGLTVRCLYNIGDVTLTLPAGANGAGIFISPQTQAGVVTGSGGSPLLQMSIREGHGITGEPVQSAQVGQRITLDIVMRDTTIYDFWVHDCYAHDGTNTPEASISIIDANGCAVRLTRAVDVPVFTTNPVPNGAKHVYVHMYGFQFTTSQLVYFECQVRPCLQSCQRAQCAGSSGNGTVGGRSVRQVSQTQLPTGSNGLQPPDNYNLTAVIRIEPQKIESVIPALAQDAPSATIRRSSVEDLCINTNVAIAILVIFVVVCLVSLFIAVYMCHRARKEQKDQPHQAYFTPTVTASPSVRPMATPSPAPTNSHRSRV